MIGHICLFECITIPRLKESLGFNLNKGQTSCPELELWIHEFDCACGQCWTLHHACHLTTIYFDLFLGFVHW